MGAPKEWCWAVLYPLSYGGEGTVATAGLLSTFLGSPFSGIAHDTADVE